MSFYNANNDARAMSAPPIAVPSIELNAVMKLVYIWMGLGLLTTAAVAWFVATNDALAGLRTSPVMMIISLVALFGTVIGLSAGMRSKRITPNIAAAMFFGFAGIMGFSLSLPFQYFVVQDPGALTAAFGTTAVLFGTMTIVGFTTKADLTKLGTYLFIGLIGIIVAMVLNWFIGSGALAFMISIAGVVIFTGLTAYDTQKIKEMSMDPELQSDGNMVLKFSIMGALMLYLDFINLFLFLLQIFGGSRD